MHNDNNGADKDGFPTIKPAEITLTRDTADADTPSRHAGIQRRPGRRLMLILLVLLAAVVGVVFFLPQWVEPPSAGDTAPPRNDAAGGSDTGTPAGQATRPQTPAATPWSDAQLARLRQQSQDLLARMLEAEETLRGHQVQEWAGTAFDKALETAREGDSAYQDRRFDEAVQLYRRALEQLTGLVDDMDRVYSEALARGQEALEQGRAQQAAGHFETALLIRPDDEAARRGLKRAGTLDQVTALIRAGSKALQQDDPEAAREHYRQALELDPYAERARQGLAESEARIREDEFRQAMSRGYAALEQARLEDARSAFNTALKLKPRAGEAREALDLVRQRITNRSINSHLQAAEKAVAAEEWQAAVENYQAALNLDQNLAMAQDGLQRARARAQLDRRLVQALANPERLWDEQVRREMRQLLQQARAAPPPRARLERQIAALEQHLAAATTPVTVPLRSDNQTSVTIYKVGELGRFEEKSVTLLPGRYVAVGTRPGYRDVRVEFSVRPGRDPAPVVIETREKIRL